MLLKKTSQWSIQYTDREWRQIKTGRMWKAYNGSLKNPSGQVFLEFCESKTYLESKGIKIFIKGFILFTNPSVKLSIEKDTKTLIVFKIDEMENLLKHEKRRILKEKIEMIKKELNSAISATTNSCSR